jgi:type IV secretion system protein TrbG
MSPFSAVICFALTAMAAVSQAQTQTHAQSQQPSAKRIQKPTEAILGNPADTLPIAMPSDGRVVRFQFAVGRIYRLLSGPMKVTTIELEAGETLKQEPTLGDSIRWEVIYEDNFMYIKPTQSGIDTTLAVVTNRRTYHFTLVAEPEGGMFYQSVSFNVPLKGPRKSVIPSQAEPDGEENSVRPTGSAQITEPGERERINGSRLNFKYTVKGDASFRPTRVYDDGKFIRLQIPDRAQWPTVYIKDGDDEFLVETHKDGSELVVHKIAPSLVLRLDSKAVYVTVGEEPSHWWQSSKERN